jgi:hypothetical protein
LTEREILKWYLRIAIAAIAGCLFSLLHFHYSARNDLLHKAMAFLEHWISADQQYTWRWSFTVILIAYCPGLCVAIGLQGLLARSGKDYAEEYTRCRRCKHILSGLFEPRCPECGERI